MCIAAPCEKISSEILHFKPSSSSVRNRKSKALLSSCGISNMFNCICSELLNVFLVVWIVDVYQWLSWKSQMRRRWGLLLVNGICICFCLCLCISIEFLVDFRWCAAEREKIQSTWRIQRHSQQWEILSPDGTFLPYSSAIKEIFL